MSDYTDYIYNKLANIAVARNHTFFLRTRPSSAVSKELSKKLDKVIELMDKEFADISLDLVSASASQGDAKSLILAQGNNTESLTIVAQGVNAVAKETVLLRNVKADTKTKKTSKKKAAKKSKKANEYEKRLAEEKAKLNG